MPIFLKLQRLNGGILLVNVAQIVSIFSLGEDRCRLVFNDGYYEDAQNYADVKHSLGQVEGKIEQAGGVVV